ncbi:MAG: hypothetical protein WAK33_03825 [Silvibacterium sp.]
MNETVVDHEPLLGGVLLSGPQVSMPHTGLSLAAGDTLDAT